MVGCIHSKVHGWGCTDRGLFLGGKYWTGGLPETVGTAGSCLEWTPWRELLALPSTVADR